MRTVQILVHNELTENDRRAKSIAGAMGLTCTPVSPHSIVRALESDTSRTPALLAAPPALEHLRSILGDEGLRRALARFSRSLFVYGLDTDVASNAVARALSSGVVSSCQATAQPSNYEVADTPFFFEFSGLTCDATESVSDRTFAVASKAVFPMIRVSGAPMLIRLAEYEAATYLLGGANLADLDDVVEDPFRVAPHFSGLIPLMCYLRSVFDEACWHNPAPTATLIIDDPLLREHYGFLRFRRLLEQLDRHDFSATLAFIPFNFERSAPSVAKLFTSHPERLSLCLHGCDHTRAEFGSNDALALNTLVRTAKERMHRHQLLTGIPCAPIMVFPQGIFSSAAMDALVHGSCTAAVNTSARPVHSEPLRLRDHLQAAVVTHGGFPLFTRRYPTSDSLIDHAFDLFAGKPALLAAHHDDFRAGYRHLTDYVQRLRRIRPDMRWTSLQEVVESTFQQRHAGSQSWQARAYGLRSVLRNAADETRRYRVSRAPLGARVGAITVDGVRRAAGVDLQRDDFDLSLPGGGQAAVEWHIDSANSERRPIPVYSGISVRSRRYLSEFRDNWLARWPALLKLTGHARNAVHKARATIRGTRNEQPSNAGHGGRDRQPGRGNERP